MKTKKNYFILLLLFSFLTKIRYLIPKLYLYSIKIQTDIYQNTVKYLRKITDFWNEFFWRNLFFIFGLGPTRPMWLGWTQPPVHGHWPKPVTQTNHARVKFYECMEQCEGNYITFALFMLVFANCKNEPLFQAQKLKQRE